MNIVTSYFKVKHIGGSLSLGADVMLNEKLRQERQMEYLQCLHNNVCNSCVESVHLLVENEESYQHFVENVLSSSSAQCREGSSIRFTKSMKSKLIPIWYQANCLPLYSDLFAHANKLLENRLTMICNADVYIAENTMRNNFLTDEHKAISETKLTNEFVERESFVQNAQMLFAHFRERQQETSSSSPKRGSRYKELALALTRYEDATLTEKPLIDDYRGSHDAFIVEPPVSLEVIEAIAHPQNCYQAENVVLYELKRHGYLVLNPCLDMHLIHNHHVNIRQWLPSVVCNSTSHATNSAIPANTAAEKVFCTNNERYERAEPLTLSDAIRIINDAF